MSSSTESTKIRPATALRPALTAEDAAILARNPARSDLSICVDNFDYHCLAIGLAKGDSARAGVRLDTMILEADETGLIL